MLKSAHNFAAGKPLTAAFVRAKANNNPYVRLLWDSRRGSVQSRCHDREPQLQLHPLALRHGGSDRAISGRAYADLLHQCPNDNGKLGAIAGAKTQAWENVFLAKAIKRLQPLIGDYSLTTRDVKDMMEMCAYETVSVGYSAFCSLFTEDEWKGFQYR